MFKLKLSIIAIVFASLAYTQEFTLFEAQEYAVDKAEKIKKAELDFESAKKKVVETRAIGLPQVSTDFNFQNFLSIPVQVVDGAFVGQPGTLVSFRAGTDYMANAGLTVNQLLFDGSYIIGLKVSNFYKKFVEDNIEKTIQDVLYDVTQAYELALVSKANLTFLDSLVASTQQLVNKQEELFTLGMIAEEDLDQIKYALLQAQTNLSAATYSYQNALALLKMTMAYPMEEQITLTENLDEVLKNSMSLSTEEGDVSDNLQLKLLEKQRQLSEYDLQNTRMAYLPKLNASFGHQYNYFSNEFDLFSSGNEWFDQTYIGLNLKIPITSSGMKWAKVQQAKIAVKQDEYTLQEFQRSLQMQETQFKNDLITAKEQLALQKQNVVLAKRIYDNSLIKAEIGKESSIVVTQKYQQLVAAQTQYVNASIDVFTAKLNIDQLYNKLNRN